MSTSARPSATPGKSYAKPTMLPFSKPAATSRARPAAKTPPSAGAKPQPKLVSRPPSMPQEQLEFHLTGEFVELHALLKLAGVCDSGGAGKALVATGAVWVDGQMELRKTCKLRVGQMVSVDGTAIAILPPLAPL